MHATACVFTNQLQNQSMCNFSMFTFGTLNWFLKVQDAVLTKGQTQIWIMHKICDGLFQHFCLLKRSYWRLLIRLVKQLRGRFNYFLPGYFPWNYCSKTIPGHTQAQLLQCAVQGAVPEDNSETAGSIRMPQLIFLGSIIYFTRVTLVYDCFWTQCYVLVITYQALYSLGPGSLNSSLVLQLAWTLRSSKEGLLCVPPLVNLSGGNEREGLLIVPRLWNTFLLAIQVASSVLVFRQVLKMEHF